MTGFEFAAAVIQPNSAPSVVVDADSVVDDSWFVRSSTVEIPTRVVVNARTARKADAASR